MRSELFYVDISHLSDSDLEFFGYTLVASNEKYKLYSCYDTTEHLVEIAKPFLLVGDVNDAVAMKAHQGFTFRKFANDDAV